MFFILPFELSILKGINAHSLYCTYLVHGYSIIFTEQINKLKISCFEIHLFKMRLYNGKKKRILQHKAMNKGIISRIQSNETLLKRAKKISKPKYFFLRYLLYLVPSGHYTLPSLDSFVNSIVS